MSRVRQLSIFVLLIGMPMARSHAQSEMELLPPLHNLPEVESYSSGDTIDVPPIAEGPIMNVPSAGEPEEYGNIADDIFADGQELPIQPAAWLSNEIWDYGLEVGINGSEGNKESFSLIASGNMKRETELNTFSLDATYGKNEAGGIETQHYALLNTRFDYKMTPRWFLFNKNTIEYDEFKAFDLRQTISGGLGYHFIKRDFTKLTGRFGAGVSREFGGPDDEWKSEADFGLDFEQKLTERQKLLFSADYYPTWETFVDYRMVSKASWEYLLDHEMNLSLKLGAIDRYDSSPNGAKHNDIDYFLALLWKI